MTELRSNMNPSTVMRLYKAWEGQEDTEMHTLMVGAISGCWPGTIYRAVALGYLRRNKVAHFIPTRRMLNEVARVRRIREIQREKA